MIWLLIPLAYLLGSISAAWLAGRAKGIDLRQHGSGNLGATNAGRVLGGRWFAIVFTADVVKGMLPVLAAQFLPIAEEQRGLLLVGAAAGAVLGHVFTCFHGFKGGKAVATSLGVLVGIAPPLAGLITVVWLITWGFCQWKWKLGKAGAVGPASTMAALVTPPLRWLTCADPLGQAALPVTVFLVLLAALVFIKHIPNIRKFFTTLRSGNPG